MKIVFSAVLALLMLLSVISLAGCGKAETLKFGMGIYSYTEEATNADGDTNGEGEAIHTAAAVLLNADGKIVKCVIDTADITVAYTSEGKAVASEEFKTKYELGSDYGMVAYGGAAKEWYEQVDAFVSVVEGKTIDEVKALVADGGKGTEDVITAGCTIGITDFISALENAVKNATDSDATADDTLKLGVVSAAETKDATEEADGSNEVSTTVVAAVLKDSKVVASSTDVVSAEFTFNAKGESTVAESGALTTKKQAGANYGMASYGTDLNGDGTVKEWNEQAAAFDEALKGKTADEISALAVDTGYGVESLQTAGCTINVNDMVKAAVKAAK